MQSKGFVEGIRGFVGDAVKGRGIYKGICKGFVLKCDPISFLGGVDAKTGKILHGNCCGKSVKDKILVFPYGVGSTVGSYVMYQLKKNRVAPKAIVCEKAEPIIVVGAVISEIPMVDMIDISLLKTGDFVFVDGEKGIVAQKSFKP